jgi:hypothetical protein
MPINLPSKDPDDTEPYHIVWIDKDGTNDGTASDNGELQGATISTSAWTVPSGITEDSNNTAAITIAGVSYAINTVATIWLSGGTAGTEYELTNKIVTSDSRTLSQSITIEVKEH